MYRYGILIASDSRSTGERRDLCADVVKEILNEPDFSCAYNSIVSDDLEEISKALIYMSDELKLPLIITSGGTGFSPRDHTPEATLAVVERQTPGISEAIRQIALSKTPMGMLSRAASGIRKQSLIINLPGSPKAVRESLEEIKIALAHGLDVLLGRQGKHKV